MKDRMKFVDQTMPSEGDEQRQTKEGLCPRPASERDAIDIENLPLEEDMDQRLKDTDGQQPRSANDISDEDLKKLGEQIAASEEKRLAEELYRRFYLNPLEAFEDWVARNMATSSEAKETWSRYVALKNKLTKDEQEFVKMMMSWSHRLAEERNRS